MGCATGLSFSRGSKCVIYEGIIYKEILVWQFFLKFSHQSQNPHLLQYELKHTSSLHLCDQCM